MAAKKQADTAGTDGTQAPITIKKYANRRLYNKATSTYVTLDHLSQMVKDGVDFVVFDAKSGDDITRSVLTQIIVEEESKGQNLLPTSFLRNLISFYGDSLQGLVPSYLEHSMDSFTSNQDQFRNYFKGNLDGVFPFNQFEELGKQNMAMLENAMKMFNPGAPDMPGTPAAKAPDNQPQPKPEKPAPVSSEQVLDTLKEQLVQMQEQLNALQKPTSDD